jgi:hypothetical protein
VRCGGGHGLAQVGKRAGQHGAIGFEEIGTAGKVVRAPAHRGPQATPYAVALDRRTGPATDGVPDTRGMVGVAGEVPHRDGTDPPARRPGQGSEGRTVADSPDQAESRFRPRVRRDRKTARPPRVRIRVRKPCVFLRFLVFGWYVRFTALPPRVTARSAGAEGPRGRRKRQVYRALWAGAERGTHARRVASPLSRALAGATFPRLAGLGRPPRTSPASRLA